MHSAVAPACRKTSGRSCGLIGDFAETLAATRCIHNRPALLGWHPAHDFERGLAATVRWYLDNRPWWQAILDRGYKAERVGLLPEHSR
jgi:hypothetical protein